MVKIIKPKTQKAVDFVAENGDKFIFPPMQRGKTVVISAKTGKLLVIEAREDGNYVNNQKMEW